MGYGIFTFFFTCFYFCPALFSGFTSGYIDWGYPDNYDEPLINKGVLPSGTDTQINFCCRNDGVASQAIYLPTDASFMLLTRFGNCQLVSSSLPAMSSNGTFSLHTDIHFWGKETSAGHPTYFQPRIKPQKVRISHKEKQLSLNLNATKQSENRI